jgi:hypothetical protein
LPWKNNFGLAVWVWSGVFFTVFSMLNYWSGSGFVGQLAKILFSPTYVAIIFQFAACKFFIFTLASRFVEISRWYIFEILGALPWLYFTIKHLNNNPCFFLILINKGRKAK